tara:strand:- start:2154 stop:3047 length:894 start_codon:yes stop_codon:yes gene_type:complete
MKILEYLIYLILKFLNILPQSIQYLIGKGIGKIFYKRFNERREIARWNLKKCFPEKNEKEIRVILKQSFERLGESLFEFLNAFWAPDKKLKKLIINFDEIKNIVEGFDKSKGKLLLFMHTPNLDLVVRTASLFMPVSGMARTQNNKIIDNLFKASRKKFTERIFNPSEILELLNFLKNGKACLYAPDQDYGYKSSIFVDFFGHKALTVKFPYLASKRANCDVYLFSLKKRGLQYSAALEKINLKKENVEEDLKTINSKIENYILSNPENYLWSHRRFKNRPEGEAPFYPADLLRKRT